MKNSTLKLINIQKFGMICMAGFTISKTNILTMHHIIEKSHGGLSDERNSSNVTILPHSGIHILSQDDYKKRKFIIDYLTEFKQRPDLQMSQQFAKWLDDNVKQMGYREHLTKDHKLIYKRR